MKKTHFTLAVVVLLLSLAMSTAVTATPSPAPSAQPGNPPALSAITDPEAKGEQEPVAPAEPDSPIGAYTFTNLTGTYTPLVGATTFPVSATGTLDDGLSATQNVPFNFDFGGTIYTTYRVNTNGWLGFGAPTATGNYSVLSSTANNVIAFVNRDYNNIGAVYSNLTEGTAPNRIHKIEAVNFYRYNTTTMTGTVQVWLYETTNVIEIHYGPFAQSWTSGSTVQVGLKGASTGPTDVVSLSGTGATTWSNPTLGNSSTSTMELALTVTPDSGRIYRFTPAAVPDLSSSAKTAASSVLIGSPLAYTIRINNTGTAAANSATLNDPIPVGTSYVAGTVSCTSGSCLYSAGTVSWAGTVAALSSVTVTFSVDTTGVACGTDIVNTATISDTAIIGGAVVRTATTTAMSSIPILLEGFESTTFPPAGWSQTPVTGTYSWDRVTTGTNPTIAPHGGGAMARWNAYSFSTLGNGTRLTSPVLTLPATPPPLSFYMSHDTGYATPPYDRIDVQLSTDGGATWPILLGTVNRYDANCATACWQQHTFSLTAYAGMPNIRVGLLAITQYGNNFFVDDVAIATPGQPCAYVSLTPASQAGAACRGSDVDYTLSALNYTPLADVLNLTHTGTWPTTLTPTSLSLAAGGSGDIDATVHIPWASSPGDVDTAVITATGATSGMSDSAQLQTTSLLVSGSADSGAGDLPAVGRTRFHSVVYYNNHLYKFGGYDGAAAIARAYSYDIAATTWVTLTDMPAARYGIDCGLISGMVYCAGGWGTAATNTLYIYDIAGNTWTTSAATLPASRYGYVGAVVGGKYYVMGGASASTTYQTTVYAYDPVAGTWATLAPMTAAHRYGAGGVIGGKIYVAGGYTTGSVVTPLTEVYDPATNIWTTAAANPYGGWMNAADGVLHDRFLVLAGGYNADLTASNYALAYDAVNNTWAVQGVLNHQIYGSAGDGDGTNFWFISGRMYEGGSWMYSRYTSVLTECGACVPASGVDFTFSPASPAVGQTTTFTATVAAGSPALTYNWDFGDTTTGTGDVVTHSYAAAGTYTVVLTVTNCDGTTTVRASHPVVVTALAADLSLVKTDTPDPVTVGGLLTYTIVVTNNGPDAAANVMFTDTLPADFTFVNGTVSAGACVVAGDVITCAAASLASAGTITGVFWGTVDAATCPGTLSNTAIVTSDVSDPTPANNTDTEDTAYVCAGAPAIVVAPAALSLTVPQGYSAAVVQTLTISNTGTAALDWTIYEQTAFKPAAKTGGPAANPGITLSAATGAAAPAAPPARPEAVLWDQPLSTVDTNAYVDQAFSDFPTYSSYMADDFVNAVPWSITNIFVPGGLWNGATTLATADSFTWLIYADNAGVPAGDPSGGGSAPVWSLTLLPSDTQVVITNGSGGTPSDVMLNLTAPVNLPAGNYWLIFYPTAAFGTWGQYGRQAADTTNGYTTQFINPGGGFGYGSAWQSWSIVGATLTDMAFRIEGTAGSAGCTPTDIPWLSLNPLSGTTAAGAASPVDATYSNMSALAIGTYTGNVCVESNDPVNPTVLVPVTLIVRAPTAVDMTALAARTAAPLGLLVPVAGALLVLAAFVIVRRRRA